MSEAPPDRMGVLLIEDDDDDALIVEDLLAASSVDVRLVRGRTLQEGLHELSGSADCVLLDLITRTEELDGKDFSDDVAMLLVGSRDITAPRP